MEGEAAIPLETTRRAFRNQLQSKQRSALVYYNKIKKHICTKMMWFNFIAINKYRKFICEK